MILSVLFKVDILWSKSIINLSYSRLDSSSLLLNFIEVSGV